MQPAQQITPESDEERFVHGFDLIEINAPNPRLFRRLSYLWRLRVTVRLLKNYLPRDASVLDLGCASGNMAITLAEAGYHTTGVDMREGFISYSRKKDDDKLVIWVHGDAFKIDFPQEFSGVVMSEIIEHVTEPVDLLRKALSLLADHGVLVVSTPNGASFLNKLPSFEDVQRETDGFRGISIGPAGEDHIYAYRLGEFKKFVAEAGGDIAAVSYVGSILLNTHVQSLLNMPGLGNLYFGLVRMASHLPWLGKRLAHTMLFVITRRTKHGQATEATS